jgi:hypothetical protein
MNRIHGFLRQKQVVHIIAIAFKHPVAFICASYTLYSVFNATLHLQLRIFLFYFTTCLSHKGPSSGVLFAKTVALYSYIIVYKMFIYSHVCKYVICLIYTCFSIFSINIIHFLFNFNFKIFKILKVYTKSCIED